MKHFSLPVTLDLVFYTAASWLLAFGLLRALRLSTGMCVVISLLAALSCLVLLALFLGGRQKKRLLSKKEREESEALLLHLALEKEERVRAALLAAYRADGRDVHCEGDYLRVDGELAVPLFTMQPLSADEIAGVLKKYGGDRFFVLCNSLTPEAEKLLHSFGKLAVQGDLVYRLFSRTETMPKPLICGELPRRGAKLRRIFSKENARPFFVSGALLLFMSLFAVFPVYYLTVGCILLALSVVIHAVGFRERQ